MKKNLLIALSIAATGILVGSTILGQDSRVVSAAGDKYVISAKAGGVNYIEGSVVIARKEGRSGQLLKGDEIQIGDSVATGADGRAEILLNPGSYMRIDKETEFSFATTALDDLRIKLNSGNAIFEVIADNDFKVSVHSPKSDIELTHSGVYRIDVAADGSGKISVWKGAASVGSAKTEVKAGRAAIVNGETVAVAKFDRDQKDPLDVWSKDRAKELTKVNAGLQRKVLRDSLLSSFNRRGWNMYDSFGLWIFDPGRSFWCFMPFGYGWGSPYGFGYGYDFWTIGMPRWIYFQPPPTGSSIPQTGGSPATGGGAISKGPVRGPDNGDTHGRLAVPPFMKIENNQRGSGDTIINRRIDLQRGAAGTAPVTTTGGTSTPASAPVSSPPMTISIPNRNIDGGAGRVKKP